MDCVRGGGKLAPLRQELSLQAPVSPDGERRTTWQRIEKDGEQDAGN